MSEIIVTNPKFCKDCDLPRYCCNTDLCVILHQNTVHTANCRCEQCVRQLERNFMESAITLLPIIRERYPDNINDYDQYIVKEFLQLITKAIENEESKKNKKT